MTSGHLGANLRARVTREWKLIARRRSYFRIAFANPICPARVRASVPLSVACDQRPLLRPLPVRRLVHADDGDLVVGEQVALDRLAKGEPVNTVPNLAVSSIGGDFQVGFLRRPKHPARVVARGRGHEQPSPCLDRVRVENRAENG